MSRSLPVSSHQFISMERSWASSRPGVSGIGIAFSGALIGHQATVTPLDLQRGEDRATLVRAER
jgi:hypothetical protein